MKMMKMVGLALALTVVSIIPMSHAIVGSDCCAELEADDYGSTFDEFMDGVDELHDELDELGRELDRFERELLEDRIDDYIEDMLERMNMDERRTLERSVCGLGMMLIVHRARLMCWDHHP